MTRDEWYLVGVNSGWVSPLICLTHDGVPMTNVELEQLWDEGLDACVWAMRMYADDEQRVQIETDFEAIGWRKPK